MQTPCRRLPCAVRLFVSIRDCFSLIHANAGYEAAKYSPGAKEAIEWDYPINRFKFDFDTDPFACFVAQFAAFLVNPAELAILAIADIERAAFTVRMLPVAAMFAIRMHAVNVKQTVCVILIGFINAVCRAGIVVMGESTRVSRARSATSRKF